MGETTRIGLPLVASAQAQKHITVNESLLLLDALIQGQIKEFDLTEPPSDPVEGDIFVVAATAMGDWSGHEQELATFTIGGWRFVTPLPGWKLRSVNDGLEYQFDGSVWTSVAPVASELGASISMKVQTLDETISPGTAVLSSQPILENTHVLAVTAKVTEEITSDTGSNWRLGVAGSDQRYGSGLGLQVGSFAKGLSGTGITYYEDTPLLLSCEGGAFTGGKIRLAVHYFDVTVPA